jgi:hypothetical protein
MARGATVLGIGVAAIASCQRFRADTESMYTDLDARQNDIDACEQRSGQWDADRARCAIDVVLADHPLLIDGGPLPAEAP